MVSLGLIGSVNNCPRGLCRKEGRGGDSSARPCLPPSLPGGFQGTLDLGPPASSTSPPPSPTSLSSPPHLSPKGPSPLSGPLSTRLSVPGTPLPVTHPSSTWQLLSFRKQCGHLLLQAGLGAAIYTSPSTLHHQSLRTWINPLPLHATTPPHSVVRSLSTGALSVPLIPMFLRVSLCLEHVSVQ